MLKNLCRLLLVASLGLLAAGCSTHQVDMIYMPTAAVKPTDVKASVEVFSVSDSRKYTGSRLGAIRGGYGNALKTLETKEPVRDVVRKAFLEGLTNRGLLAPSGTGQYGLEVDVTKLDCSQYVRREAHAQFRITILDKATGRPTYTTVAEDDRVNEGSLVENGIFGSVEELRKLANEAMQAAVDRALDGPGFQLAVGARK